MAQIFEPVCFSDYRDFLKYRYDCLKSRNYRFSINACAEKANLSKSLLQFIFTKKRHIGIDRMPPLAKALNLREREERWVYLMICKSSSKNPEIQIYFEGLIDHLVNKNI